MHQPVRAAVVQAGAIPFDTAATLDKALALIARCAERGVQLAVFPEAFIGGYPKGMSFGAVVGARRPEGRDWFARYFDAAIAVPGPETGAIGEACANARLHAVIGVIERDGGTLYCTALFFAPDGTLLGKHRTPQADAHRRRAPGLGLRGRLHPAGIRYPAWTPGCGDLLGKLHAHAAHGDVREEHPAVLRADRR
jgi:nitrilase